MLLTKMLTCTAARPTVAGAIRRPTCRSAGSPGAHTGLKRQPRRRSEGTCTRNCASPPASVPNAQPTTTCSTSRPSAQSADGPQDRDHVEERGRQRRDAEAALGVQHPHRHRRERHERQERHHHARQAHRELGLAGRVVEARRDRRDDRPGQEHGDQHERAQGDGQEGQDAVREPESVLLAALLAACGRRWGRRRPRARPRRRGRAAGSGSGSRSGRRPSGTRPRAAPRTPARGRGRAGARRASSTRRARRPSRGEPFPPLP